MDGSDFFCGLTFPVDDSHATLVLGGWGGTLCGISSFDDEDAAHNDTKTFQRFETGKWYHVRLRVTPGKLQAWVDDKSIVDVSTNGKKIGIRNEMEATKPLGLTSFQTQAEFKDIKLTAIPAEVKPRTSDREHNEITRSFSPRSRCSPPPRHKSGDSPVDSPARN